MIRMAVPLAVAIRDRAFAEAVTRGLAVSWRELKVRCDDWNEAVCSPAGPERSGELPSAVLTDEDSFPDASERYPEIPLFVIGGPVPTERSDVSFLHPFSGAREIGASVLETLGCSVRPESPDGAFCVTVTSAAGGCGVSSVATALARTLRRMRRRPVLYVSYEPYPSGWRLFGGPDNGRTAEDYLFRLASTAGHALPEAYLREDPGGVRYFAGSGTYNELIGLSRPDAETFFGSLRGTAKDGTVVFDAPSPDLRALEPVLNATHILLIVGDGTEETERRNALLERLIDERFAFRAVIRVVNESRPDQPLRAVVREGDIILPYDPDSMQPDRISLEKGFGSGVIEIAERLERIRRGEEDEAPRPEHGNGRVLPDRGRRPAGHANGRELSFR